MTNPLISTNNDKDRIVTVGIFILSNRNTCIQDIRQNVSFDFVHYIMRILSLRFPKKAPVFGILSDCAEFMLELTISEYNLVIKRPSTIAVSAILNALECVNTDHLNIVERIEYITFIQSLVNNQALDLHILSETKTALLQAFRRLSGEEMEIFAKKLKNRVDSSQKDIQRKNESNIKISPVCVDWRVQDRRGIDVLGERLSDTPGVRTFMQCLPKNSTYLFIQSLW